MPAFVGGWHTYLCPIYFFRFSRPCRVAGLSALVRQPANFSPDKQVLNVGKSFKKGKIFLCRRELRSASGPDAPAHHARQTISADARIFPDYPLGLVRAALKVNIRKMSHSIIFGDANTVDGTVIASPKQTCDANRPVGA